jgi:DNA integrity scanning protein DisA with diadenylate cyclase activity
MNEVKELVEELRNKKSRDNRDLLDRSADMIEKLAKELCDKSGCHHKCNDTKDCVVEDEAKEVIANFATTTEKQIEELIDAITGIDDNGYAYDSEGFEITGYANSRNIAEALYNAGYRKQKQEEKRYD